MSCFVHRIKEKEKRRLAIAAKKKETEQAVYSCTRCGNALFDAGKKFEAGCGFPSFWTHIGDHVKENFLTTYGRERVQLLCNSCGQHLGHLFDNRTTPSKLRYCINADAIRLEENSK